MPLIELSGGPYDGQRGDVPELLGRFVYDEDRVSGPDDLTPMTRLLAGERVLASEIENPHVIEHVYSRTEPARYRSGALVYEWVKPRPLDPRP